MSSPYPRLRASTMTLRPAALDSCPRTEIFMSGGLGAAFRDFRIASSPAAQCITVTLHHDHRPSADLRTRVMTAPIGYESEIDASKLRMWSSSQTHPRWKSGSCRTPCAACSSSCANGSSSLVNFFSIDCSPKSARSRPTTDGTARHTDRTTGTSRKAAQLIGRSFAKQQPGLRRSIWGSVSKTAYIELGLPWKNR